MFSRSSITASTNKDVLSVAQLVRRARMALEGSFSGVWVRGEISNLRRQSSGHQYFSIKDAEAQLSCVLFRGQSQYVSARIEDGLQVELFGDLSVFEARGTMQLTVRRGQAAGRGALQAAFEALKAKLQAEGLFDADRKKALPRFPQCVALVTSPTGAALQDMLTIFGRRSPWVRLLLFPVKVQGEQAAAEIAAALRQLSQGLEGLPAIDAVVVARGGGSYEDLWSFNEEAVARAIAACPLPTISAVGHEIDFTIADFVADLRAPTPSAAAELLAPDGTELRQTLEGHAQWLENRLQERLRTEKQYLQLLEAGALHRVPQQLLAEAAQWCDHAAEELTDRVHRCAQRAEQDLERCALRLESSRPEIQLSQAQAWLEQASQALQRHLQTYFTEKSQSLEAHRKLLQALGPQAILERGFTHVSDATGRVLRRAAEIQPGTELLTRFADGTVRSIVQ
jgi:exodeoxyribonuclease VII large subunit